MKARYSTTACWELSLLRLNQLNYFDTIKPENAELKRNVKAGTVDIKLKLKEKGKQSISFNGGVSGIAGTFIGGSYTTNNFLGLGETLSLSAQVGSFQRDVRFGFTEPYLFDRPISTGFTIFSTKFDYNQAKQLGIAYNQEIAINPALQQNYTTNSKGFTVFASYPLRKFSFTRVGVTYGYSTTNIQTFSTSAQLLFDQRQVHGPGGTVGAERNRVQQDHADDFVQHGEQSAESDERKKLLLRPRDSRAGRCRGTSTPLRIRS